VESNLGYLEYEMCSLLNVTPKQLGRLREDDPTGLAFMERSFIHRKVVEHEMYEKQKKEAEKAKGRRPRRR
jgi:hypothetical protein